MSMKAARVSPDTLARMARRAVQLDMTPEVDLERCSKLISTLTREDIRALCARTARNP